MNSRYKVLLAAGVFALALTHNVKAQVETQTTTTVGEATTEVKVDQGTVLLVYGNDLIIKTADGKLIHFANVPESARATVDGQQLGIHDLKPGMTLQRTITTTTTPETITTVKKVTGTIWEVNPPSSVILTLEDGKNQQFKILDGQKFNIDGQITDAWGLRKGMKVSATKISEQPEEVIDQQRTVTGNMPPPPPDPEVDLPVLIVVLAPTDPPAPAPDPAQVATAAPLPKTGSQLPLIGILGLVAFTAGLGFRTARQQT